MDSFVGTLMALVLRSVWRDLKLTRVGVSVMGVRSVTTKKEVTSELVGLVMLMVGPTNVLGLRIIYNY